MTTNDEGLAGAVREIQKTATLAASLPVVHFDVDDGKGGKVSVPSVLVTDGDGKRRLMPLLDEMKKATEFAREQRLGKADGPDRREGTATLQALTSFIAHANRFKAPHSAIWANADERELVSVLDYHPEGHDSAARWGKHRGIYSCPLSDAWEAWGGEDGRHLDQDAFATLLDTRDADLVSGKLGNGNTAPNPAYLVTMAANLEVYSSAKAKRERDPQTQRVKLTFSEEKGVAGDVMPPPAFLINIPVFKDGALMVLEVRLRVTIEEGAATFHLNIHHAEDVLRVSFNEVCFAVGNGTGLPVYVGTPE